jgi:hypothetical protein
MAIGDSNDTERLEIAARQAATVPVLANGRSDPQANSDAAHCVRTLMDRCRHPVTGALVGVSK